MSLHDSFSAWMAVRTLDGPIRSLLREQVAEIFFRHRLVSHTIWNRTFRQAVREALCVAAQTNCPLSEIASQLHAFDQLLGRIRELARLTVPDNSNPNRVAFDLTQITPEEMGRLFTQANDLASKSRDYSLAYQPGEYREETWVCEGAYDGHHGDSSPASSTITWTESKTVWSPQTVQLIPS